jgi:predicted nucleic-acid-binding protein
MLAADTNILARYLLDDDKNQSPLAARFLNHFSKKGTLYFSPFMLMELAWLLKAKGLERQEIVSILEKLVDTDGVLIGQKNVVISALHNYRKHNISFSDSMIVADADINANANTATFDNGIIKSNIRGVRVEETL